MQKGTNLFVPSLLYIYRFIISHRMQGKCDVDVSFRHMFCKHHMALRTMHHGCDVVRCVLYLFYFLELPFFYPFYFTRYILLQSWAFARKTCADGRPPAQINFTNPATVDVRHLRVPVFPPFLRPWQFREHDGHMHQFRSESVDQQLHFH